MTSSMYPLFADRKGFTYVSLYSSVRSVRAAAGSKQERRLGERSEVLVADDLLAAVAAILEQP